LKDEDVGAEVKATEVMKRKRDHDKGLIAKCGEEGLIKVSELGPAILQEMEIEKIAVMLLQRGRVHKNSADLGLI
jgi:hypothetical protein